MRMIRYWNRVPRAVPLIKAIHRACPSVTVECYELMPENREFLHTLNNVILLDEDFNERQCRALH